MKLALPYSRLKEIYVNCPLWVQRAYGAIPLSWRAGSHFRSALQDAIATEFLSADELALLQAERLRNMLGHAFRNIPHFRDLATTDLEYRLAIDPLGVLKEIPFTSKEQIQVEGERFVALGGVGEAVYRDNTGGSSGQSFSFLKNNSMYTYELACMMSQWRRVGYVPGDRKVTLRGRSFPGRKQGQRWLFNPIYNELVLSAFHLEAEDVKTFVNEIGRFRPKFIHGYPSAITTFLEVVADCGFSLPRTIKAVLCGSEPLYDYQRSFIEKSLGCPAFSWYGQSECVLLGGECKYSREYHFMPLYGVLELVDEGGDIITEPGIEGEIIGTSLQNMAMPFIRYRTGDRGVYSSRSTCECGREFPRLERVSGRIQHFVYTRSRRAVPVTAFIFGQHFEAFSRIRAMQLVQENPGVVLLRVVTSSEFDSLDEQEIKKKMISCVDGDLDVQIERCVKLPLNAAGKTDFVIQKVELGAGNKPK